MTTKPLPTFITDRLILRAVTKSDIPSYQKHFADYEVIQYLASHVPWPYPENGVAQFLENMIFPTQGESQWLWGLFEKEKPTELIGAVHLWRECKPENRGFWLGKKFWGKGYMTEAVAPVMNYAFEELNFEKLIFANAVGNNKSRRIKEKTGARLLRVAPAKFVNPQYTEHEIWELTKEEWNSHRKLEVKLVKPSVEFKESYLAGLKEFQDEGLPWVMDIDPNELSKNFEKFVQKENSKMTLWTEAPPVPQTELWGIVASEYVGRIAIRHRLNEILKIMGGHIGYDTRPSYRGRGIANSMLKQALPIAKALGITEALLTCNDDNLASIRIIEKNGGELKERKLQLPNGPMKRYYWIKL
jgi:ribosomal-protein-alanine N-acetyltransferase